MSKSQIFFKVDGLAVRPSGSWIKRKHYFLTEYAKIFTTGMGNKWAGRLTFLDLFAGPGKCSVEKNGLEEIGSPLIALQYPFGKYVFVEESHVLIEALRQRCSQSPKVQTIAFIEGDANGVIKDVIKQIPSGYLSLAFIDPTDIDIHFETVKALAALNNGVDLIMNIQYGMDVKRNFVRYRGQGEASKLQRFLGMDFDLSTLEEPHDVIETYKTRIRELGYETVEFRDITVKNSNNAEMYFLLFASKHPRGLDFWEKITKKDEQGQEELF